MSSYAIYFSPTGGTKRVLDIVGTPFSFKQEFDLSEPDTSFSKLALHPEDIVFFAVPSYGGRVPAVALERMKNLQGGRAKAVLIAVFGNRAIDDTLLELKNTLTDQGFVCAAAVKAAAEHSIMRQYGASRPDQSDESELRAFAEKISNKCSFDHLGELTVPGNFPYREYKGVPLKPHANKSCVKCGKCAEHCPVGAISKANPAETDFAACISCMRCMAQCPSHARQLNPIMLKAAQLGLKSVCSSRKPNKLYL